MAKTNHLGRIPEDDANFRSARRISMTQSTEYLLLYTKGQKGVACTYMTQESLDFACKLSNVPDVGNQVC